jgi:hypothetical protein
MYSGFRNMNFSFVTLDDKSVCSGCKVKTLPDGRPVAEDFMKYIPMYLKDNPGVKCAKG